MTLATRYKYCQEAIELKKNIEKNFLNLAECLYFIKKEALWQDAYSSWDEFCDELGLNNSTIHRLITVYEVFVIKYDIPRNEILQSRGWSVLSETVPLIGSKRDAKAWLHKASTLSLRDTRKEVLEAKLGIPEMECKHEETYIIKICSKCGQRERIYD